MMQRLLIIVTAVLNAFGSRVARPTPGTETILLVKGGYGPGLNLISAAPAITKRRHGVHKAPMDRTEKEEAEVKNLEEAGKVVSTLQTQITEVGQETAKVLSEAEASRVEQAQLKDKLSKDAAMVEQEQTAQHETTQLQMQVQQLRSQIMAEKAKTAAEKARSEAFVSKVQTLEKNMHVITKAWKGLATHEATLAKAAQGKSTPPAKPAPAAKKATAAVPAKKESNKLKPKVIHMASAGKKVVDVPSKAPAKMQKHTGAVPIAEDDITDDVLASDSDDDAEDDESHAATLASADTSDSDADADSQVDDGSDDN